jgi:ribonuclease HI
MREKKEPIIIYTDGSCEPNPGPGGWCGILLEDGRERILKGSDQFSTNNRMELTAAIHALMGIDTEKPVVLYTDSQYLKMGVEKWMHDWQARNWKRKGGSLANVDLWKQLSDLIQGRKITWRWVRSHTGNPFNEKADRIARGMIGLSSKVKDR